MKIKRKDLRKGLAQLPINYPAPTVEDVFNFEEDKQRVETICKKLAHVEVEVRDAALAEIPRYLQGICETYVKEQCPDADVELMLQKLAMGLFYCFWHSDKPLVQHECAHKIALLMNSVSNASMQRIIIESIFRILSREWGRIDRYRLDKYMSLVRKLVYQMLMLIKRHYTEARKQLKAAATASNAAAEETDNAATEGELTEAERIDSEEQAALAIPFISGLTTFFHKTLLVEARSVGLTMHMMDVILDELIRSDVDVALFVRISEMLPLFAMSRGDFVEKKVLDNFIGPIVSGVLDARRVHTIATSPETIKEAERKKSRRATPADALTTELAERNYSDENDQICIRLATSCKLLSVEPGTRHNVRPMLSESQMLIEQHLAVKLNPKQFRRLTHRDMRRRVTKELQEAEEAADKTMKFRKLVKDERRDDKKKARKLVSRDQNGIGKKKGKKESEEKKKNGKAKKHIVIDDSDAAGHEQPAKKKKDIDPAAARALRKKISSDKNISEKVKEEVVKLAQKEERRQAKSHRLEDGESESKISAKGNSQNSKRHKYGKLSYKDIVDMEKEETPVWRKKK